MAIPDIDALVAALNERGLRSCPACGSDDWKVAANLVGINSAEPTQLGAFKLKEDKGFSAVMLICGNCGLMHLHNIGMLLGTLEVAEDSATDDGESDDADEDV